MRLTDKRIEKHLSKSGKIRRASWPAKLYLKKINPHAGKFLLLFPNKHGVEEPWQPNLKQLRSRDWQIIPKPVVMTLDHSEAYEGEELKLSYFQKLLWKLYCYPDKFYKLVESADTRYVVIYEDL